jgi:hypothetical protein
VTWPPLRHLEVPTKLDERVDLALEEGAAHHCRCKVAAPATALWSLRL